MYSDSEEIRDRLSEAYAEKDRLTIRMHDNERMLSCLSKELQSHLSNWRPRYNGKSDPQERQVQKLELEITRLREGLDTLKKSKTDTHYLINELKDELKDAKEQERYEQKTSKRNHEVEIIV